MVKSGEVTWVNPNEHPKSVKPCARSGHTITCMQEKAIVFGGCGIEDEAAAVFNDTHMLHITDGYRWEKVDAMGDVPPPRWRHTATLLPDNNSIFVFGGLCKGKRYNDTYLFDVARNEWSLQDIAGTAPHPRSHHTATLVEFDEEEDGDAEKKVPLPPPSLARAAAASPPTALPPAPPPTPAPAPADLHHRRLRRPRLVA